MFCEEGVESHIGEQGVLGDYWKERGLVAFQNTGNQEVRGKV